MPVTIVTATRTEKKSLGQAISRFLGEKPKSSREKFALQFSPSEDERAYLLKLKAAEDRPLRSPRRFGGARSK